MKKISLYLFLFCLLSEVAFAEQSNSSAAVAAPPNQGLFSLPMSQMIGPLYSFGQNIIGKDRLQIYFEPAFQKNTTEQFLDLEPSVLYGFSDQGSIYFIAPIALDYRNEVDRSSGFADSSLQLEYAFYATSNATSTKQATVMAGINFPTGSYNKSPPTGEGTSTFFFGTTYEQNFVDWYWFTSPGIQVATKRNDILLGTQYLYQFGAARNIVSVKDKYIFALMAEFDGQYSNQDTIAGAFDPDSGGNTIFITPSLWFSTKRLILQLGVALPVVQHLFGEQDRTKYFVVGNVGWTFDV